MLPKVSQCEIANDIWIILQEEFASTLRSQMMSLLQRLQNLRGSKLASAYILKINAMLETLAIAGEKLRDHHLVILVLAGHGDKYESLIQNVTSRSEPMTYRMLKSMMLDIDTR